MTQAAVLAVARDTFDVILARELATTAMSLLSDVGLGVGNDVTMSTTAAGTAGQVERVRRSKVEVVIVLQATFTDASAVISLARVRPSRSSFGRSPNHARVGDSG
jgi:hypothetical protein